MTSAIKKYRAVNNGIPVSSFPLPLSIHVHTSVALGRVLTHCVALLCVEVGHPWVRLLPPSTHV